MFGNFDFDAQNVLFKAKEEMLVLKHPYIGTEHLILSILKNDRSISERLSQYELTYDVFKKEIIKVVGTGSKPSELFLYTPLLKKVIENAIADSKENNNGNVTVSHLLSAILEIGEGIAIRILMGMDINIDDMYDDFAFKLVKSKNGKKSKRLLIDEFGVDLTERAKSNKLDPVIGREDEIKRVLEILCRRGKNNPILIGPAGVGKTAIVEELSRMIACNEIPGMLKDKRIISLDMASLVAGTKYRGEFEDRIKKILKEIEDNEDIIVFIDEIHTLVGAGGAEGAIDASNILKPSLARGKIRCIGATTDEEYKRTIEKETSLDRRFQRVNILAPSVLKTKDILLKLKPIYENYHHVVIRDSIIDSIVDLSERYIFNRNQPDKSIDILDEVCSMVSLKRDGMTEVINKLENKISSINKMKNSCVLDGNFDKAYSYRKEESLVNSKLNKLKLNYKTNKKEVLIDDVATVIHAKTKIPIYEILRDNVKIINKIKFNLCDSIIGQDKAINSLIDIIKRIKFGYKDENKGYSLLFIGPTGVGKTKMAKLFSDNLIGDNHLIRLDMSEYSEVTSVNKILGSPAGYVGYDDCSNVLEEVRNNPYSVILLDEIEKAHVSVINLFYQILDEGKIKDSKGNIIRFDNTVIVMTSNLGFEKNSVGFSDCAGNYMSHLKDYFSLSFINRIDNIVLFNKLTKKDMITIVNKRINILKNKYKKYNIEIKENVVEEIIDKTNYVEYGARKVDKIIQGSLENQIIDSIIIGSDSIIIDSINKVLT